MEIGALVTFFVARAPDKTASDDGPICTTGKRCGDACISIEYDCDKNLPSKTHITTTGWIVMGTLGTVGLGLIIASLVAPKRMQRRRLTCGPTGCGLTLRF